MAQANAGSELLQTALTVEAVVRAARVYAAEQVSWLAPALFTAPIRLCEQLPSPAAIDRYGRVYVNPRWIERLQARAETPKQLLAQVGFLLTHEVWHWLRAHSERAEAINAQPQVWNLAADMEINDYVPEGLALPDFGAEYSAMLPSHFNLPDGHLAEWYYRRLLEQQQSQAQAGSQGQNQAQAGGQGQSQAQSGGGQSQAQAGGSQGQSQAQSGGGQGQSQAQSGGSGGAMNGSAGLWDEGSGVHGQARPWEISPNAPDTPALNDFDRQSLREEVAHRILQHHKDRGTMPAGWVRWAEEVLRPQVDWRKQLQRIVRGAISEGFGQRLDYSYRRPHRRAAYYAPLILPALQGERRPFVAVVVDTSGSISDTELSQALVEVRAVLEQLHTRVVVIPCDAVPYEAIKVFTRKDWEQARGRMRGGGGTDMPVGIRAAQSLTPPPDVIIVLTDGHTPFPAPPSKREAPVIWGIWRYGDNEPPKPPCPPWRARDIVEIPIPRRVS